MKDPKQQARRVSNEEMRANEAVVAARQARHELERTGPAPTVEAILEEMGRDRDGYPLSRLSSPEEEWIAASEAALRALSEGEQ